MQGLVLRLIGDWNGVQSVPEENGKYTDVE